MPIRVIVGVKILYSSHSHHNQKHFIKLPWLFVCGDVITCYKISANMRASHSLFQRPKYQVFKESNNF